MELLFRKDHAAGIFRSSGVTLFRRRSPDVESPVEFLTPQTRSSLDFTPVNVLFCGRRKKGKSLAQAGVAKRHSLSFARLGLPWKVISNHWLSFADYNSPYLLEEVWEEDPHIAERSEVIIDEMTAAAVSRRPTSRTNVNAGRWVEQVRKLPAEVLSTTQFPTEVDHYFTRQIDIFILVEGRFHPLSKSLHPAVRARYGALGYIDLYIFDLWGQWTGKYDMPRLGWPPPLWRADDVVRIGNIPSFWDDYRSNEMIPTMWGSDAYREKVIAREGWTPNENMVAAGEEYEAKLTSEFAQAQREGTLPEVSRSLDVAGGPVDQWLQRKAASSGGAFTLSNEQIKIALELDGTFTDRAAFSKYLEALGYDVDPMGRGRLFVQKRGA